MKKVLIAGGAGYVGGAITDLIESNPNYKVRIYDALLYEDSFRKPVDFVFGDVRDHEKLKPQLEWADVVVWLAAIVGDGRLREELEVYAESLGLTENIEFLGKRKDVEELLMHSKVFVLPSKSEGLSIAMIEAMSAGVVPVVPDVGDLGDRVIDGVNGYLIEPNKIEEYAEIILSLLQDQDKLNEF